MSAVKPLCNQLSGPQQPTKLNTKRLIMKTVYLVASIMVAVLFAGCAGNRNTVIKPEHSVRQGIFTEAANSKPVTGKALVKIDFPVKTYKSRIANTYIKHSDPPYTAILVIDGQSIVLTDEPALEELPGDFKVNPEAGTGWKYNFRKELLLNPGKHQIRVEVPLSGVVFDKEVTFTEGENLLKLIPVYNSSVSRDSNYPKFVHGLKDINFRLKSTSDAK
jgi:hypothetical protein